MKPTMADEAVILVFAKAPVPGDVKTRMIPALGEQGAALLHAALTERVLDTACATGLDVILYAAPDCEHAFFADCEEYFGVGLAPQLAEADLGERMLAALNESLQDFDRAILIGADCPALTAKHLLAAIKHLEQHDVVLTPAEDGGYVLVGAKRTHQNMFANIEWGEAEVLASQRAALQAAGLTWQEMETLWDVDRPEDLPRLRVLKPSFEFF